MLSNIFDKNFCLVWIIVVVSVFCGRLAQSAPISQQCSSRLYVEFKSRTSGAMGTSSEKIPADNEFVGSHQCKTLESVCVSQLSDRACKAANKETVDSVTETIVKGLACRGATEKEVKIESVYAWAAKEKLRAAVNINAKLPGLKDWVSCGGAKITMQDVCDEKAYMTEGQFLLTRLQTLVQAVQDRRSNTHMKRAFDEVNWSKAAFDVKSGSDARYKSIKNCLK